MRIVVGIVVALTLAGCATVPRNGPVHEVEGEQNQNESAVRYNPPGPTAEASPSQIVYGFLDAMLAFPVRSDTAKEFLTEKAANSWNPRSGTVVYSQPRLQAEQGQAEQGQAEQGQAEQKQADEKSSEHEVKLTYTEIASLDTRGRYTDQHETDTTVTWRLVREHGEWRISSPPSGVMVSEQFFGSYYLPLNLYFFDSSGERLVADPVYQPEGDQLATTLVASLLSGPAGLLAGEARSYLPDGMSLDVSVPVTDEGVANVQLSGSVASLSEAQRERMAAQVVWTVRQAHGINGVRIAVNDSPLKIPGVGEVQSISAWDRFDPGELDTNTEIFALRNDRLVTISGTSVSRVSGPWGKKPTPAVGFRVDTKKERIAVVPPGRSSVQVGWLSGEGEPETVATGNNLLRPAWDTKGRLWVIDREGKSSSLSIIDDDRTYQVPLGPLADTRLRSFELSPDNNRFVAIAQESGGKDSATRVVVGVVEHDSETHDISGLAKVRDLNLPREGLTSPTSATWRSAVGVVVLASLQGGLPQPYVVRIDGSSVSGGALTREPLLGEIGAEQVLCSGILAAPVYVSDTKNRLWVQDVNGRWQQITGGPFRSPSFPG